MKVKVMKKYKNKTPNRLEERKQKLDMNDILQKWVKT